MKTVNSLSELAKESHNGDMERSIRASDMLTSPTEQKARKKASKASVSVNLLSDGQEDWLTATTFTMPIKTVSELNRRDHWSKLAKRKKEQKKVMYLYLMGVCVPTRKPTSITFTRLGTRTLDTDNLASAFKACRDSTAEYFGFDDGDEGVKWLYAQEKVKRGCECTRVRIDFN